MSFSARYGTLIGLLAIIALFAALSPEAFAKGSNLINITQQMSLLAIVALGATFVMSLSEFDLSVGAVVSMAGIVSVTLFGAGWGIVPVMLVTLIAGFAVGAVSGLAIATYRMPSFIVTLAMGTIVGGITYWISDGATLFGNIPVGFRDLGRGYLAGIPVLTLWALAATLFAAFILDHTELGRRILAIGGNREAARLTGVRIVPNSVWAFGLCTLFAALAGLLLTARLGSAHPTGGNGFLLQAYAAVFLGMTAFRDGQANALGTLLGAAIIAVVANGLTILGVPNYLQDIFTGLIIIGAVLVRNIGGRAT
ncbi:MAG: ABC transporter permease [Nitratireductor sp.]|uniref:ABC transporter permease n=1 Tax=Nitratireductor sp. B36 TaxID=2762059 RepID=UPI000C8BC7E5|nr:ABC transporter permease [Nitratireductor sp. B36]MAS13213.1 ABC transporter permease [Nitratireductor sp.]MCC5781325.1 ABC transporter permease [Nitratireductor sp. B36]